MRLYNNLIYNNLIDYEKSINEAKELNGTYNKDIIFHCYWNGNLNEFHLISIKSCYYFNVLNNKNNKIILWLENNIPNNINQEVLKYSEIKELNLKEEKNNTFLEKNNIKKNLKSNIINGVTYYSDFIRILLLYKYGGCWFDLDILFLRNFDPLFNKFENYICVYAWGNEPYPNNAIMFSLEKKSEKMKTIIEFIIQNGKGFGFQKARLTYDTEVDFLVLPCAWFDPIYIENPYKKRATKFFIEETDKEYSLENFFRGAFTYHWHNFGDIQINKHSIIDQLSNELDSKLKQGGGRINRKQKTRKIKKGGNRINLKDITIGILSWKSHNTLRNTLESYKQNKLLDNIQSIIYFQEISEEDKKIADEYNILYMGTDKNLGIETGFVELINNTKTPYFIFAENDFELVHNNKETKDILSDCIKLLENNDIKVVKLRDRHRPGDPLFSKDNYNPTDKNFPWKLEALHFLDNPENNFPDIFEIINYKYKWYKCSNIHSVWSNNIFIAKTKWLKEHIVNIIKSSKNNTKNYMRLESIMKTNSRIGNYNVAGGIGLFTHNRIDR